MLSRGIGIFLIVSSFVGISLVGLAQVDVVMTAYLVQVDAQTGEETLISTDTAMPGDMIEYVIEATNTAQTDVKEIALVGPIPSPTILVPAWYQSIIQFLDEGADPPVFCVLTLGEEEARIIMMSESRLPEFSVDSGETYWQPPVTYVVDEEIIQATADMFTHIRWTIEGLNAGEKATVSYRVVLP